jgi:hypothetical protein
MTEEPFDEFKTLEEPAVVEEERHAEIAAEPLLTSLMRGVMQKTWPDDVVMADFVQHVLPPLSEQLVHVTAKGGEFAEAHRQEGRKGVERVCGLPCVLP